MKTFRLIFFYAGSYLFLFVIYLGYLIITLPNIITLENQNPKTTSFIEHAKANDSLHNKRYYIRYEWIPISHVPEIMQKVVIVSEDASFWIHEGIDWFEIKKCS